MMFLWELIGFGFVLGSWECLFQEQRQQFLDRLLTIPWKVFPGYEVVGKKLQLWQ